MAENNLIHDPVEDTAEYKAVIDSVMDEVYTAMVELRLGMYEEDGFQMENPVLADRIKRARGLLKESPSEAYKLVAMMGDCHSVWGLKKRLLKTKHNIDWQTPAELNPDVLFD
ncbi:MAG: hypothetical protein J6P49_03765 [Paludibacteraceae bacterium]|nr:hypothetical protein [Paludibacteraceae bacterium]MBP5743239.1 hypothetical protein [Paludibacteraceae bacterium]